MFLKMFDNPTAINIGIGLIVLLVVNPVIFVITKYILYEKRITKLEDRTTMHEKEIMDKLKSHEENMKQQFTSTDKKIDAYREETIQSHEAIQSRFDEFQKTIYNMFLGRYPQGEVAKSRKRKSPEA